MAARTGKELLNKDVALIDQLRVQHHAIAQLIALGFTTSMICRRTGVSQRRLTLIQQNPAFEDLVAQYAKKRDEEDFGEHDPFRELSYRNMMAGEYTVAEHFERAHEEGTLIPIAIANRISQERADRLGYSKHSVVHHEHDFASALDKAIARSAKVLIEGQVLPPSPDTALPAPQEAAPVSTPTPPIPGSESPHPKLSIASIQRREVIRRRFG